ncbi:hypothetical protein FJY84_00205 [Candidatus Bathyarchaeota archaeon]|nr:hypothetical protein [Candidatus Bathyarchaeota archaeon]
MNSKKTIFLVIFLCVTLCATITILSVESPKKIREPIKYPLPTFPEPTVIDGIIKVEITANSDAIDWKGRLVNSFNSINLQYLNSTYNPTNSWILFFKLNNVDKSGLFDLNISYSSNSVSNNYTQTRSVWVMKEWPSSLTIGQITDLHLPYGADNVATFIYEANLLNPDLFFTTGDNVDVETISSAWGYLQSIFKQSLIPSFLIPGNHDYAGGGSSYYLQYGGNKNYSLVIGDFLFIAMDTMQGIPPLYEGSYLSIEQINWAAEVLDAYPNKTKILLFHHPPLSRESETHTTSDSGGNLTGDWTKINELQPLMHLFWLKQVGGKYVVRNETTEFIKMVQEKDVRLILNGHIHSDVVHVLNGKHWFVTTVTIGGGAVPGMLHGYRIITIDNKGNVHFDLMEQDKLYDPPNAIPKGNIKYFYPTLNDYSTTAVTEIVENNLNTTIKNAKLEFLVSSSKQLNDYKWYPSTPTNVETESTASGYRVVAYVDVPSKSKIVYTFAAETDSSKPTITVQSPTEYTLGDDVKIVAEVSDSGWGIKEVNIKYNTTSLKKEIPASFTLLVNKDQYILSYPKQTYNFTIPKVTNEKVTLNIEVTDNNGNKEAYSKTISAQAPVITKYALEIQSQPVSGLTVTVNGTSKTTPTSVSLESGTYTIVAPSKITSSGKEYNFKNWSTGETTPQINLHLKTNQILIVTYEPVEQPTQPSGGIPLPTNFALIGLITGIIVILYYKKRV